MRGKKEVDIRDIVPLISIDPIVVPERLSALPEKANPPDAGGTDIVKKYAVQMEEDSMEAIEILSKNA